MTKYLLMAAVMAGAVIVGCSKTATPPNPKYASGPSGETVPDAVLNLTEGGVAEIEKALVTTKKEVVVLEFWSMGKEPPKNLAMETFNRAQNNTKEAFNPAAGNQQVKLANMPKENVAGHGIRKAQFFAHKYGEYLLKVVSVNVDGPEKKDEVMKFLTECDAKHVKNILLSKDAKAAVEAKYGFKGEVPYQIVFARDGKMAWTNLDKKQYSMLDDAVFGEMDK